MNTTLDEPQSVAPRGRGKRKIFAVLAGAVLLGILVLTVLPPEAKQFLHTRGQFHSVAHIMAFAALGFAAGRSSRSWTVHLLLFLGLIVFGFSTELVEHLSDHFAIEWKDVIGDGLGVLIGYTFALLTTAGADERRIRGLPSGGSNALALC